MYIKTCETACCPSKELAGVVNFSKKRTYHTLFPFVPASSTVNYPSNQTISGSLLLKGERKQTIVLQLSEARADLLSVG